MASRKIGGLSPTEFENFVFDLMVSRGMKNVSWRTPGADGGRDIEGLVVQHDFSEEQYSAKWFVECKRYATSVDWPTIYGKLAYAHSNGADVLLMCTSSKFTPTAITQADNWNARKQGALIRLWPGHRLESLVQQHPDIALKYGLTTGPMPLAGSALRLALALAKSVGSHYSDTVFNKSGVVDSMLQTAHALATLLQRRIEDSEREGRFRPVFFNSNTFDLPGCKIESGEYELDEIGLEAFVSYLIALGEPKVEITRKTKSECELAGTSNLPTIIKRYTDTFSAIALWADFEYQIEGIKILVRQRNDN